MTAVAVILNNFAQILNMNSGFLVLMYKDKYVLFFFSESVFHKCDIHRHTMSRPLTRKGAKEATCPQVMGAWVARSGSDTFEIFPRTRSCDCRIALGSCSDVNTGDGSTCAVERRGNGIPHKL